jgi:hypothetical protein
MKLPSVETLYIVIKLVHASIIIQVIEGSVKGENALPAADGRQTFAKNAGEERRLPTKKTKSLKNKTNKSLKNDSARVKILAVMTEGGANMNNLPCRICAFLVNLRHGAA